MPIDMLEFDMAQVSTHVEVSRSLMFAFDILGKKWNALIIDILAQNECRFSELASALPELSDRVLSVRLHELEDDNIIEKNTRNFGKAKFTYRLTEKGTELSKSLQDIKRWSKKWNETSRQ